MPSKKIHFGGENHVPPLVGSKGFIRVVSRGCVTAKDYYGDFSCDHSYTWDCGQCPVNYNFGNKNLDR